jgi:lysophospholipase L1-like esterase
MVLRLIIVILLACTTIYVGAGLVAGYRDFKGPASKSPSQFVLRGRNPSTRILVVTAGDSITKGTFSADYVGVLRARLDQSGYEFVNAGVNGDTSQTLLARIQEVIACKPDVITILIGTNDVRNLIRTGKDQDPRLLIAALDLYRKNLEQILTLLQIKTNARIAVLSIPPLGENLQSSVNDVVRRFNQSIKEICAIFHVANLSVYAAFDESIRTAQQADPNQGATLSKRLSVKSALRHYFLHQSWDAISKMNGFSLHTDGVHLNTHGASILVGLIAQWL